MGTTFHFNTTAQRFEGDGRVQRVVLADSSALPCDLVVVCIGAVAKKELLRGTPITAEKAILVDDHCRTNVPDIYAAGSCCALLDPLFGKHRWLENHDDALRTGAIAGQNMAGADAHYDGIAHFSSNLGDLSLSNWGEGRWVERRLLRGTAPHLVEIGVDGDGHVAQVLALGNAGQDKDLGALVAQRLRVDGIEESLKDPSVRLEALLGKRLA
jgi:NADPH-dependent 2,4-dienoyl-CoA reductase/sulfur reductase-like enzyme